MLKEIVIAFQSWAEARRFIHQNGFFRWVLLPGLIYSVLFFTGMYFFWQSSNSVVTWISDQLGVETWLQKKRSEWLSFLLVMTGMMLRIILVLFYFSLLKYIVLIIGSPLFAWLSEETETVIEKKESPVTKEAIIKSSIRGIRQALRNCGWQSVYMLALILLSLIPVIGWITPVIALLVECYYFGFAMLDFPLAREGFNRQTSITFSGQHKGLAIGNGILFYAMHLLIPLAPAYAVVAGTITINKVKYAG